jgi:2,4-dienoyl-CoA reductase-like NADH-dependent reductase (Old Yellow Enzyme family)
MTTPQTSTKACIRHGPALRKLFAGIFIANDGFTQITAEEMLASGEVDAVAFGRPFIANPDLPRRFALGAPLNDLIPKHSTWPSPRPVIPIIPC